MTEEKGIRELMVLTLKPQSENEEDASKPLEGHRKNPCTIKFRYKTKPRLLTAEQEERNRGRYLSYLTEDHAASSEMSSPTKSNSINKISEPLGSAHHHGSAQKRASTLHKVNLTEVWERWAHNQARKQCSLFKNSHLAGAIPHVRHSSQNVQRKNANSMLSTSLSRKGDYSTMLHIEKMQKIKLTSQPIKEFQKAWSPHKKIAHKDKDRSCHYSSIVF